MNVLEHQVPAMAEFSLRRHCGNEARKTAAMRAISLKAKRHCGTASRNGGFAIARPLRGSIASLRSQGLSGGLFLRKKNLLQSLTFDVDRTFSNPEGGSANRMNPTSRGIDQ